MNPEQLLRNAGSKSSLQMWKLLLIGFIALLLMLPVVWISELVHERYQRQESVAKEIAGRWGGAQLVSGPFLCIPYRVAAELRGADGTTQSGELTKYLYIAPDSLRIGGKARTVTHKRGIFKVAGYQAELDLEAYFAAAEPEAPAYRNLPLRLDEARVCFDLSDQRGLKELGGSALGQPLEFSREQGVLAVSTQLDGGVGSGELRKRETEARTDTAIDFKSMARVPVEIPGTPLRLKIRAAIAGTRALNFVSSGLRESVTLAGDWPAPSFSGELLPENRSLDGTGFRAAWRTSSLNSGVKKFWLSDEPALRLSNLGVNFLVTVDSYVQSIRAVKYAVMFLLLTFLALFLAEVATRQRIHPIHYLTVGCALVVFYLLLLSLSERLAFGWAYLIAATGVILQIGLYCYGILKNRIFALRVGALLAFLYAFLYLLLRLEDSALLVGSVGLFVLLTVAMQIFRRIDWYRED